MATNMEIISKEMIKPSSPTPTHLKTLKLSFLDQLAPPLYLPLIFFYHHYQLPTDPHEISPSLKQSLSEILTFFFPLGGTVQENSLVDCNDSGAEFSEARVHARLSDVIQEANMEELNKLLPVDSLAQDDNIALRARINFFDCGGVAIAVCLWHKLGDATSFMAFLGAWAATCRGETLTFDPSFDLASSFPPIPPSETLDFIQGAGITTGEKIVANRYIFSKEKISKLKEMFNSGSINNPTRVEAVSSYIWQTFIETDKAKVGSQTSSFIASHLVNMRPRKTPPFPQHVFGNCFRVASALSTTEGDYSSELVAKLRAAITSIDNDFMEKLAGSEEYIEDLKGAIDNLKSTVGIEICYFSSWVRFPVYEIDFGWGKPVWVCTTSVPVKNVVVLMRTPCGEGIEAWVSMLQDDVEIFEQSQQLID